MKTKLQVTVSAFFLACTLLASPGRCQTIFSSEISGTYSDVVSAASLVDNNAAILFSGTSSEPPFSFAAHGTFIGKMDTAGNLLWNHIYDPGKDNWNFSSSCILQRSYGYLIGGSLDQGGKRSASLMKIDANGNFIDYNRIRPDHSHHPSLVPQSMTFRPDGALIMAGYGGQGHEHSQMIWIKTDETFSSYSVKAVNAGKDLTGVRVFAEPDNSTIVACTTGNLSDAGGGDNGSAFPTLIKMDADGNVVFTRNYKMSFYAVLYDCIRLDDGSFILVGTGQDSSFIEKIKPSYRVDWFKSYPIGNDNTFNGASFQSVSQTSDGGYLIGGRAPAANDIDYSDFIMKTNATGDATSYTVVDGSSSENEAINKIVPLSSTRYLAVGANSTPDFPSDYTVNIFNMNANLSTACNSTVHIIKGSSGKVTLRKNTLTSGDFVSNYIKFTETIPASDYATVSDLCAPLREESIATNSNETINIIPNPASSELTIQLPLNYFRGMIKIEIVNMLGQEVAGFQSENSASFNLNVGQWQKGNYLVRLIDEEGRSIVTKLQVQ